MPRIAWLLILTPLVLSACQTTTPVATVPKTVTVEVDKYVTLPPALTAPCAKEQPVDDTWGEVRRVAAVRGQQLDDCGSRMDTIRNAQPDQH